ncbi:MAG: hypothetical protein KKC71_07375 [Chloroflexi bacterium]|nr:hypothetical protein [Chloroflexota bacterium]
MKSKPLSQMAVMNVDEGEEIAGGWASPHIPQVGIYKLLAKKKRDGSFEWAHFVQRDNGLTEQVLRKEKVYRGQVKSREQLDEVLEIMNKNLHKFLGVTMRAADYNACSLDGKKASPTKH